MPSSYPTSYSPAYQPRNLASGAAALAQRSARGFQSAGAVGRAANVNVAAAAGRVLAANENAVAARALGMASALRPLAGIASAGLRVLPYIGLAVTAYELYELYKSWGSPVSQPVVDSSQAAVTQFYPAFTPEFYLNGWQLTYVLPGYDPGHQPPGWPWDASYNAGPMGMISYAPFTGEVAISNADLSSALLRPIGYDYSPGFELGALYVGAYHQGLGPPDWDLHGLYGFTRPYSGAAPDLPLPNFNPAVAVPYVPPTPVVVDHASPVIFTIDPASQPVVYPLSTPSPIPYALIPHIVENPWRVAEYQRQAGYRAASSQTFAPNELSYAVPSIAIAETRFAAQARPLAGAHILRPPSGGDKERKVRTSGYGVIAFSANALTESKDALDAVYAALPKHLRSRHPTVQQQLRDLYHHWEDIDAVQAVENLFVENLKDRVYGALGGRLARQYQKLPERFRPHGKYRIGYQIGPAL